MLVLSTVHISESTANRMFIEGSMDEEARYFQKVAGNGLSVILYTKGEHGWLVPINTDDIHEGEQFNNEDETPKDLATVIRFALEHDCSWVMFDKDAEFVESLPKFDW